MKGIGGDIMALTANTGGLIGGAVAGFYALGACLALGPIGWLIAFAVVPIAVLFGAAGGAVLGFVGLGLGICLTASYLPPVLFGVVAGACLLAGVAWIIIVGAPDKAVASDRPQSPQ